MGLPDKIEQIKDDIIGYRREFHQIPEPGFKEKKTSERIARYLDNLGLEVLRGIGVTGVVGLIRGQKETPCIALRADMDALPVEEQTGLPFASRHKGFMHACGHDGHIAMLLGLAEILSKERSSLPGCVKLIFQPGEEGFAGAKKMIEEGCLDNPAVDMIIGCHLWNHLPPGYVGVVEGPMMAAADHFQVVIEGPGGHGATPHETPDPILAAAHLIISAQNIISRKINPMEPAVLSFGTISGGYNFNVIADRVTISGTTRSIAPQIQDLIEEELQRLTTSIASQFQLHVNLEYRRGYPPLINHPAAVKLIKQAVRKLGALKKITPDVKAMVAEDMAFYLQERKGAFFFLGSSPTPPDETPLSHHSSKFNFNEEVLPIGTAIFYQIVHEFFQNESP